MKNAGVRLTAASNAALIVASFPAVTAVPDETLSARQVAGGAAVLAGVWFSVRKPSA